ncbi:MAG: DUF1295 domain-containing protein [Lachnospiraceae bacterium]|nr:DUF1295 domain-containing protein [Lachnospiraceae bacterium]
MKTKKARDLFIIALIYILAFGLGYLASLPVQSLMLKVFVFDVVATIIVFVFSVISHNSSVYDAYWSVAPIIMVVWIYLKNSAWSVMQIAFLVVFLFWAFRLTGNWMEVFTDFSYEDWRYKKFREETPRIFWPVVNFWGIHMMPTLVVFAGMLPVFEIAKAKLGGLSIPGLLVMLFGIGMELFADRQMHRFLKDGNAGEVCEHGLWKYSRHPNYLGEISFWLGVYLVMLPYEWSHWYYGTGFLAVGILFNVVSVPLMEKRQLARRPQYQVYKACTSRLLLLPRK